VQTKSFYLPTECRLIPLGEQILSRLIRFCSLLLPLESDHLEDEEADGRATLSMEMGSEAISTSILFFWSPRTLYFNPTRILGLMEPAVGRVQRWALVLPGLHFGFCCVGGDLPARSPASS
jgi:hypothetical protein